MGRINKLQEISMSDSKLSLFYAILPYHQKTKKDLHLSPSSSWLQYQVCMKNSMKKKCPRGISFDYLLPLASIFVQFSAALWLCCDG